MSMSTDRGQSGTALLQRLQKIAFAIEEEEGLSVPVVASRVGKALDVEKVTKRFYERFRTELAAFGNFIGGITAQGRPGLVRLPHVEPHDVHLLHPEAGLPRRRSSTTFATV